MRKHQHHAKPGEGYLAIGQYSGLRKLMRAARRGKIPDERTVIIETAEKKSATNPAWRKRPQIYEMTAEGMKHWQDMWSKPFDYPERLG